ncbi:hypothetical protein [Desulfosporosinus sp. HMP52]|nr:hypothetical protein [Desulfosporosinus sp. HMP52]
MNFVEDTILFDYAAIVLEGMDSQIIDASISEPVNTTRKAPGYYPGAF